MQQLIKKMKLYFNGYRIELNIYILKVYTVYVTAEESIRVSGMWQVGCLPRDHVYVDFKTKLKRYISKLLHVSFQGKIYIYGQCIDTLSMITVHYKQQMLFSLKLLKFIVLGY